MKSAMKKQLTSTLLVLLVSAYSSLSTAEWLASELYSISVIEKEGGPETSSDSFTRQPIGNFETLDGDKERVYQVINLRNTLEDDPPNIVLEIQYSDDSFFCWPPGFEEDFSGGSFCPPFLEIKQISEQFGADQMGNSYRYTKNQLAFIEQLEIVPTLPDPVIDGNADTYCPRDIHNVRFQVSGLPTTPSFTEQAVYSIGVKPEYQAHFKIKGVRALDPNVEVTADQCPIHIPEESGNCVVLESGDIERPTFINDTLHFAAVPADQTRGEFVGLLVAKHLPPQFTVATETINATIEFSNSPTITLPDNCEVVNVQNDLGSQWAQLRIKLTAKRFNIQGQLIETKNINKIESRWDWDVQKAIAAKTVSFTPAPPAFGNPPNTIPVTLQAGETIVVGMKRGEEFFFTHDVTLNPGARMRFIDTTSFFQELFCKTFPSFPSCDKPKIVVDRNVWVYVGGSFLIDTGMEVEIKHGSGIGKTSPNAQISGLNLTQGDINSDGITDRNDLLLITSSLNTIVAPGDPRDLDGDGRITILDARKLTLLCTFSRCGGG